MARTEARVKTAIWNNEDFRALPGATQHLYWTIFTQPTISLCGVIAYTPGRWARLSSDGTVDEIDSLLGDLELAKFLLVDLATEEVFVRSFMRNDGVWNSPKTRSAAVEQSSLVGSVHIRKAIECEMERLKEESLVNTPSDALCHTVSDGV